MLPPLEKKVRDKKQKKQMQVDLAYKKAELFYKENYGNR